MLKFLFWCYEKYTKSQFLLKPSEMKKANIFVIKKVDTKATVNT